MWLRLSLWVWFLMLILYRVSLQKCMHTVTADTSILKMKCIIISMAFIVIQSIGTPYIFSVGSNVKFPMPSENISVIKEIKWKLFCKACSLLMFLWYHRFLKNLSCQIDPLFSQKIKKQGRGESIVCHFMTYAPAWQS